MLVKFTAYMSGISVYVRSEQIEAILPMNSLNGSEIHTKNGAPRLFVRESPDEVAATLKEFTSVDSIKARRVKGECERLIARLKELAIVDDSLVYMIDQTQCAISIANDPTRME